MQLGVFLTLQPQGSATDKATFQFFGIPGILKPQTIQRLFDHLAAAVQQFMQQVSHTPPVDAPDARVDEAVQIAHHQTLQQQNFEPVRSLLRQRCGNAQAVVHPQRQTQTTAQTHALTRGFAIARPTRLTRGFGQTIHIGDDTVLQTRRQAAFRQAFQNQVALGPGQCDQAQSDAVAVMDIVGIFSPPNGLFQTLTEFLGLGSGGFAAEVIVLGDLGHLFAHALQRDRDDLFRQGRINRKKLIQPQAPDHIAQAGALNDQRKQRIACGQHTHHAAGFRRHAQAFGHGQRQCQCHSTAQTTPQDRTAIGGFHMGRQAHDGQRRQKAEQDQRPRQKRRGGHDKDQTEVHQRHVLKQTRDQQRGQNEDHRPRPVGQQIPRVAHIAPRAGGQHSRGRHVHGQAHGNNGNHTRCAEHLFRKDVRKIGQCDRGRDLRQFIALHEGHAENRKAP